MILTYFSELLYLSPYTPFLLRLAVAIVLAYCAWKHSAMSGVLRRLFGLVEILVAVLIAVGAWTQIAAVLGFCIVLIWLAFPSTRSIPLSTGLLVMVMTVCIFISGAGHLAFDLPL